MGLGADLGGGNVDISFVLKAFLRSVFFHCFYLFLLQLLFLTIVKKKLCPVVIWRGRNLHISMVLVVFYKMRVFSQMRSSNDFFEKPKGQKRTWANPMSSTQCKSFAKLRISFFCLYMISNVHLALLYNLKR